MNVEGLRVTNFNASTAYIKQARFTTQLIPELIKTISGVSDNYEKVEKIEKVADSGIKLYMEGEFNIDITREKFTYQETVKRDFQVVKNDFVSLLTEVKKCLQLPQLWGLTTAIQAVCPTQPKTNVQDILRTTVIPIKDDQINQLSLTEFRAGLRLYGKQGNGSYSIVIEPLFVDTCQFYISVGWSEYVWFDTPSVMGNKLDGVYEMLTKHVNEFIRSLG